MGWSLALLKPADEAAGWNRRHKKCSSVEIFGHLQNLFNQVNGIHFCGLVRCLPWWREMHCCHRRRVHAQNLLAICTGPHSVFAEGPQFDSCWHFARRQQNFIKPFKALRLMQRASAALFLIAISSFEAALNALRGRAAHWQAPALHAQKLRMTAHGRAACCCLAHTAAAVARRAFSFSLERHKRCDLFAAQTTRAPLAHQPAAPATPPLATRPRRSRSRALARAMLAGPMRSKIFCPLDSASSLGSANS